MLRVGLNPYGIACAVGLVGRASSPFGLSGFLELAQELGARSIELHMGHVSALVPEEVAALRYRLAQSDLEPVLSAGPPLESLCDGITLASEVGAKVLRVGLTRVLCGDRARLGESWHTIVEGVRRCLGRAAPFAADAGVSLAIENHQDFGSRELAAFCEEAGPSVGVCLDTGNALAVGEDPVRFARNVAPLVRHIHLKDYRCQFTDQGYRLVRCAIGDGAVPLQEIYRALELGQGPMTASLEPGALEARHIRLFTPEWWEMYPERQASDLAACLLAARRNRLPGEAEWQTPWERGCEPVEVCDYEMAMMRRSVDNMQRLGWM